MRGVFLLSAMALLASTAFAVNVTYDHRAVVIDGKRRLLVSGSIHYPRSTPQMWPELIKKSKEGGLDVIETYVFWNIHEPSRGQYDFEGNKDLVQFVKAVGEAGMYVHLRIGPYVCAEWNYGGFPVWLHFVPGVELRTDNGPYKAEMKRFTGKIISLMKQEKLYASQGGPIILSQIENEYGNIAEPYGASGKSYIRWSADMALKMDTGVPWVMCQQEDAPDPIINTCNGFYCDQFTPNSYNKPKMWTENWTGWFLAFGGSLPSRPTEDVAFAVARFYQRGGTFQNYYMYHGGTNFGRTTGGPFISTSYDYDAPLDEYGIPSQPKWGHLRDLHMILKQVESTLLATDPTYAAPGKNLETAVYKTESGCVAFLANTDTRSSATMTFNGNSYDVPAWSVSILPDCKTVAYNSAKINALTTKPSFTRQSMRSEIDTESLPSSWSWINEPIGISKDDAFSRTGLLEQINTTADKSDYLWYSLSLNIKGDEAFFDGSQSVLHVQSLGHAVHAFVNKKLAGSGRGNNSDNYKVALDIPVTLSPGKNTIDLLSLTVGLQNYGSFFDKKGAGITGPVQLKSSMGGAALDLSTHEWTYQIGLKGEDLDLGTGNSSIWNTDSDVPKKQPLTWYKTIFDAPSGDNPVAIDFTGMGKGEAWVNGNSIGRYWPTAIASTKGCEACDYRGQYSATKCRKNCGKPSQSLYHVPREWLQSSDNTLVLFEEVGGDPTKLALAARNVASLCAHVSESNLPPVTAWSSDAKSRKQSKPILSLECPSSNQTITDIKFASFGTPHGICGQYYHSDCSSQNALSVLQKACLGSKSCEVEVSTKLFGDPCASVTKSLAVEASCT